MQHSFYKNNLQARNTGKSINQKLTENLLVTWEALFM